MQDALRILTEQVAALAVCDSDCRLGLVTHSGPCVVLEDGSMALVQDGPGYKLGRVQDAKRFLYDIDGAEAMAHLWNAKGEVKSAPHLRVCVVPFGDAVARAYESTRDLLNTLQEKGIGHE